MTSNETWGNPDSFVLTLRCTERRYARDFVNNGSIKFSKPRVWAESGFNIVDGRNDSLEGVVAACYLYDLQQLEQLDKKYPKTVSDRIIIGSRLYFKLKRSMELPCFCLYILKNRMFDLLPSPGTHKFETEISAEYFRGFAHNMTIEQVELLSDEKKPAVIAISDFDEFYKRLQNYLYKLGLTKEEIIVRIVHYHDFDEFGEFGWFDLEKVPPYELFVKSMKYQQQSELRIVINTEKTEIIDFLDKNVIEIGRLDDISHNLEVYIDGGMRIEMTATIVIKD